MYNRDQVNVINTINNISAFGRAHASEYDFSIDNEVSNNVDVVEENQLSEDTTKISSSEELSVEDDPTKED